MCGDNVHNSSSTGLVDKFCGDNVHSSLPSGSVNREQQKDRVKESLPSLIDMVVIIFPLCIRYPSYVVNSL